MEINRVGKRRRACTAGEVKEGWRVKERKLQRVIESRYDVCLKPLLIFLHRSLTHLNLLPGAFRRGCRDEPRHYWSRTKDRRTPATFHSAPLCTAAILSKPISHFTVEIGYSEVCPGDGPIWGQPKPHSASQGLKPLPFKPVALCPWHN